MKIFLTLKTWQLFLLMWIVPFLSVFVPHEQEADSVFTVLPMLIFVFVYFGWLFMLGEKLPCKLPKKVSISKKLFSFHFAYITGLIIISFPLSLLGPEIIKALIGILFIAVLYYMISVFFIIQYVAKILASVEKGKLALAGDYMGYILLLWFSPVGIWIIQPKVRELFIKNEVAP
jgi:hypothetical protein